MTQWADPAFARRQWKDAPTDDVKLQELLDAALPAVVAYAPAIPETVADAPTSYKLAHTLHARELWNAQERANDDAIVAGDFVMRARALTTTVKQLLRPASGRPRVG